MKTKRSALSRPEKLVKFSGDDIRNRPIGSETRAVLARIAAKQAAEDAADAPGKELVAMRLDSDILRWLRQSGKRGYSTRINSILRAVMEAR